MRADSRCTDAQRRDDRSRRRHALVCRRSTAGKRVDKPLGDLQPRNDARAGFHDDDNHHDNACARTAQHDGPGNASRSHADVHRNARRASGDDDNDNHDNGRRAIDRCRRDSGSGIDIRIR